MTDISIPSNPEDRKRLGKMIVEASNALLMAKSKQEHAGEIFKVIKEEFELPPKISRRMATDYMKDAFDERVSEHEEYETLYESVMLTNQNSEDDEQESED